MDIIAIIVIIGLILMFLSLISKSKIIDISKVKSTSKFIGIILLSTMLYSSISGFAQGYNDSRNASLKVMDVASNIRTLGTVKGGAYKLGIATNPEFIEKMKDLKKQIK